MGSKGSWRSISPPIPAKATDPPPPGFTVYAFLAGRACKDAVALTFFPSFIRVRRKIPPYTDMADFKNA
jgi:hypothetical protein